MTTRSPSLLLSTFRSLSLSHSSLPSIPSTCSRSFHTSHSSNSDQSSWSSPDPSSTFAPASSLKPSSSKPPRRNSPRGFQSRSPPPSSRPSKSRGPPPLPSPNDPHLSIDNLHPTHLSALRLHLLQKTARIPTLTELSNYLPNWLKQQHKILTLSNRAEEMAERRKRVKQERLDAAWEWERSESIKMGFERSEEEVRKDEVIRKRIERRMQEKREIERERDREQWERIEGQKVEPSTQEQKRDLPDWRKHRNTLKERFPQGWAPPKRISREAMDLLRTLHQVDSVGNSVPVLADKFRISPEAVRRVLKSRFELGREEREKREGKRREERMRQTTESGGGDAAWSGDRGRERGEMERLRSRRREGRDEER